MSASRARVRALLVCLAALAAPSRGHADKSEVVELLLEVGEQRVISTEGVRSYSEGAAGVAAHVV